MTLDRFLLNNAQYSGILLLLEKGRSRKSYKYVGLVVEDEVNPIVVLRGDKGIVAKTRRDFEGVNIVIID